MQYKKLIIITRGFPFGRGEAFLENEIEALSTRFDEIYIYAQLTFFHSNYFDLNECRKLPKNVKTFKINKFKKPSKFQLFIKFICTPILIKEIINIALRKKTNLKNIKTAFHYYFLALHSYDCISKDLNIKSNTKIYFYSYWFYHEPLTTILLKKKIHGICFSRAHGGDLYEHLHLNGNLPFKKLYLNKLDGIFCISNQGKNYLQKSYLQSQKVRVSKLGTDQNELINLKKSSKLSLLSISAIYNIKRIHLIIEALALSKIDIEWHHFGDGPDKKDMLDLANKKLEKSNLSYQFHGYSKNKDLIKFLKTEYFDLIINTSSSEGIPVSIMEALSFGIPAIATNVGGTHELVNSRNGYLIEKEPTPEDIIKVIENHYYLSENIQQQKRKAAYETWKTTYNAKKNYTQFVEDILSL